MYHYTTASLDTKADDDPVCPNNAKHLKQNIFVK
jgi:hypothetical protein